MPHRYRHPLLALLLFYCTWLCISTAVAAPPETLRVLCYNIHYGQGMDGKYDIPRLAEAIKQTQPDLVALQEVDVGVRRSGQVHQARELGRLTGLAVYFGPTQHYEGGLFGNAVLTNLPCSEIHIQPLPYTESTAELTTYPRAAIALQLTTPGGFAFRAISTHFQHNVPADRVAEAQAMNELFGRDALPTILAGDLNATPEDEPLTILTECWTNALDADIAPSAPSPNPRVRIDYILHRGTGLKVRSSEVINEPLASDHRPVLVVFEVQGPMAE
ncbi:MAG: endonuclease/exonuclease/phosphatase family protein [Planctomycetaceae bacterium]|nr:endonuclease/exonuclease/phosphatase family protein [Planctomycetaceae bacterium]